MRKTETQQREAISRWQRELELAQRGHDDQRVLRAVNKLDEILADLEDYYVDGLAAVRRVRNSLHTINV